MGRERCERESIHQREEPGHEQCAQQGNEPLHSQGLGTPSKCPQCKPDLNTTTSLSICSESVSSYLRLRDRRQLMPTKAHVSKLTVLLLPVWWCTPELPPSVALRPAACSQTGSVLTTLLAFWHHVVALHDALPVRRALLQVLRNDVSPTVYSEDPVSFRLPFVLQ